MTKGRLEAFSDGVFAIIITIMVLELKTPHGSELAALKPLIPIFLSYLLSFLYVGIYWNNHHHLLHAAKKISGEILWANLHLLFWLSLIPFATGWMGHDHFSAWPLALYGFVLLMSGFAYVLLTRLLIRHDGAGSVVAKAIGRDRKGFLSLVLYAAAIPLVFFNNWVGVGIYVAVALLWLIPDRRIERIIDQSAE